MTQPLDRREFLVWAWKVGAVAVGAAAVWTTWDVLKVPKQAGADAVVKAGPAAEVTPVEAVPVSEARAYLTRVEGEVIALSEKCPHLSCRVDWCDTSGLFECPCHGSTFNRAGEHLSGPAPAGMERFGSEVVEGVVFIDTGITIEGPPLGTDTLNEPARGPSCEGEE